MQTTPIFIYKFNNKTGFFTNNPDWKIVNQTTTARHATPTNHFTPDIKKIFRHYLHFSLTLLLLLSRRNNYACTIAVTPFMLTVRHRTATNKRVRRYFMFSITPRICF